MTTRRVASQRRSATIAAVLRGYLAHLDTTRRISARQSRLRAERHLIPAFGKRRLAAYEPGHVDAYVKRRTGAGMKASTIARELIILRAAMRWAWKQQWCKHCPYVPVPAVSGVRELVLSPEEARRLIAAAKDSTLRLFVLLALYTGARRGAIMDLTWSRATQEIIDYRVPGDSARRKGRAAVPVPEPLVAALNRARKQAESDYVIENGPSSASRIGRSFRRCADAAGLRGCTPHTLRHTCATLLARAGVPMDVIAQYLGHRDPGITRSTYAHQHPAYLAGAVRTLVQVLAAQPRTARRAAKKRNRKGAP